MMISNDEGTCPSSPCIRLLRDRSSPGGSDEEYIIRMDECGRVSGEEEKVGCHIGEGRLHGAYLVMLFDVSERLMLARRSPTKMLWPGFWDGSVASHYHLGENREASIRNRVLKEVGVRCPRLEYRFRFLYRAEYLDVGSEHEICDVFKAAGVDGGEIQPDANEVSEIRFYNPLDVDKLIIERAVELTPWFIRAYQENLKTQP